MMKKSMIALLLLCVGLPAHAWQLAARVSTVGGTLTVGSTTQTSADGTKYYNDLSGSVGIAIAPATGYKFSKLSINGAAAPLTPVPTSFTAPASTTGKGSLVIGFTKNLQTVTATADKGGSVKPSGKKSVQVDTNVGYVFTPPKGKFVALVTATGAAPYYRNYETGADITTWPAGVDVKVLATFPMPNNAVTLNGSFASMMVTTDGPKTVAPGSPATVTPRATGANGLAIAADFRWTQTGGPSAGIADNTFAPTLTFTPTVEGTYRFRVVANSGTLNATGNTYVMVGNAVTIAGTQCNVCHQPRGLGQAEFTGWTTSLHATNAFHKVMCYDCHKDAATGGHPGQTPTGAICAGCHAGTYVAHGGALGTRCLECHDPHTLQATGSASMGAPHAATVPGQIAVSNVVTAANGDNVEITFNAKVDGVNKTNLDTVNSQYKFDVVTNNRTALAGSTITNLTGGNYRITVLNAALTTPTRYLFRLQNAAEAGLPSASRPAGYRTLVTADFPSAPKDVVGNTGCIGCHGQTVTSGYHYGTPNGGAACVVCHDAVNQVSTAGVTTAANYPWYGYMVHGIHNSEGMPSGKFALKDKAGGAVADFAVSYPSYMLNCSVCHTTPAQLTTINAEPVSYNFCMECHENWDAWDATALGGALATHRTYTAATNCMTCHGGNSIFGTVSEAHNGLLTERSGLIWDGQDVSVTEGAKVNVQITGVSRILDAAEVPADADIFDTLVVTWTARYNGVLVDPCNAVAATNAPTFLGWANTATGQVAANYSLLRAYAQGDDWVNAGISTSPGQPASTNLIFSDNPDTTTTTEVQNTTCVSNVATTRIPLTAPEMASAATKGMVSLQGKAQVKLATAYDGTKDVIQVRSKSPTREFTLWTGAVPATARRPIVDTAGCLNCHVGSLYQHGGNRIDNNDLCVMCHNEASSEQNVRLLDGVDATEAYDGKVGQTYGFKSLLHAVHSANENGAITMIYRTNGNYVWTGEATTVIPHYPTNDTWSDGDNGRALPYFVADIPANSLPVGAGVAALIYGSSAPHGTGPATGETGIIGNPTGTPPVAPTGPFYGVYRAHNLYHPTYPQPLENCGACHKPGAYALPDPTKAVATTLDAGTVGLGSFGSPSAGPPPVPASRSASNLINSNGLDDTLQGPAAAACMSCHSAGALAAPAGHATTFGFAPAVFPNGRADILNQGPGTVEQCTSCHK